MRSSTDASTAQSLGELLDSFAAGRYSGTALMSVDGRTLRFTDLAAGTRALTGRLHTLGIGQRDRVAVCAPNGLDMAVAVLGVMRAAVCAPLNPQYPRSELDFFLDDLEVRAMVVTRDSPAVARDAAVARGLPLIEAGAPLWAESSAEVSTPSPDDVALVLHTSGTTSRPKQVPLSHANLVASMTHIADALALSSSDRALNMMPLFHIHGLLAGLLAPLAAGGSAICAPGLQLPDALEWLDRLGPTWYSAVPTIHQSVVAAARAAGHQPRCTLRLVRSSSAALAPSTLHAVEALFGCPVIESYGMTEAAHQMTSNPLPPATRKPGSVGLPAGPQVTVLDSAGKPAAAGVRGEVAIRGANVMSSYHQNPEANRSAFAAGWLRTGDEGLFDSDGYLHLTGRLKEMINRGGEKIAPREIDEALLAHPNVAQAVAFAVPHATLGEDVVAAVVLQPGSRADTVQLRDHLFNRLATFKVPSEVLIVDEIPRGATGKIQRIGMAARLAQARRVAAVAPRDVIENVLAQAWSEVLAAGPVGIHDNFFSLGGDSLTAMRVCARIVALLPLELPTTLLFRHPTIAELACALREKLGPELVAELGALVDDAGQDAGCAETA